MFLQEVFVDEATSLEMLERYYGEVRADIVACVTVARAVADKKGGNWALQQRKLMIDARKWRIQKIAPQKYGAKSQLLLADHRSTPVSSMSDEELNAEIKRLQDAASTEGSE